MTYHAVSKKGIYKARLKPLRVPVPINQIHNWQLHIQTLRGDVFIPTELAIKGGMPGHGHGFPSEPQITQFLGDGDFLVEGMMFNMHGGWQVRVGINSEYGWDTVTFVFSIEPPVSKSGITNNQTWSQKELNLMKNLSWYSASPIDKDVSNRFSGKPLAASLGKALFFDKNLSANKKINCASCHDPARFFTDGKTLAFGSKMLKRHTPSIISVARHQWFYWDGRRDSLWSQAITPIETKGEMDNSRVNVVRYFLSTPSYLKHYKALVNHIPSVTDTQRFPPKASPFYEGKQYWRKMTQQDRHIVNTVFSDIGKLIAAYMEKLDHQPSKFDDFVHTLLYDGELNARNIISAEAQAGLKLFLDENKTNCLRCHNAPALTNGGFHNIGTATNNGKMTDFGRMLGLQAARYDIFSCTGIYSDANKEKCSASRFALKKDIPAFMEGAFKVPTLRNVANTAPYFHDGRFTTLHDVIKHYNQPHGFGGELKPLNLTEGEINQLVEFLHTLSYAPSQRKRSEGE